MAITSARMQIKRGNEVDFDAEKMLVGEWALSTDKRIVRICVAPNVCIRMATYDAFEVDMAKIEKILEECQTIEDVVKLINSQVSEKLELTIEYTNQAKQYRDETEQFRNEVESMVDVGIATTEKAGIVKPDGITIRVDEDGTIHADNGTVDYNELENKPSINGMELSGDKSLDELGIASVEALEETNYKVDTILEKAGLTLKNTASGSPIHLTDSANGKNVEFGLYGKAEQNGEPTPDNPIEITVSGSYGSVEVKSVGKNLIPYPYTENTHTDNGITWTDNGDGTITANGTASAMSQYILFPRTASGNLTLEKGTYILSGCPSGDGTKYRLNYSTSDNSVVGAEIGNGVTFEVTDNSIYWGLFATIISGATVNNLTFKPMIRLASDTDDTYEPYTETTSTIPTPNGLCGIKVSSGGNYTDENGQMWICDEVVKYADGSGKRIQRIGVIESYNNEEVTTGYMSTTGQLTNGAKVIYILPTPIITDLTAEEITEIEKLHTFYPITNISNDADCGMSITYMADAKNYIDNRLALIESAMLNNI